MCAENQHPEEYILVPRNPTREMLDAAWADALAEDAAGVWASMIQAHETSIVKKGKL
jgi:hypothetical protein